MNLDAKFRTVWELELVDACGCKMRKTASTGSLGRGGGQEAAVEGSRMSWVGVEVGTRVVDSTVVELFENPSSHCM